MDLAYALQGTIKTAREAGDFLLRGYGEVKQISNKSSHIDLVTEYDTAAEAMITTWLAKSFPDHTWIAEEGGARAGVESAYTWYIDPLDGTNNFAHSYPVFAVSLALYKGNQPLLAVVHDPLRDECFYALAEQGAYVIDRSGSPKTLQVSTTGDMERSLVGTGFPYDRHTSDLDNLVQFAAFLKQAQGVRRSGAAALDLANVAAGRLDGFWEYKLSPWDVAASVLLIQEAGGLVTDTAGRPLLLNNQQVNIVAGNRQIQPVMLAILDGCSR